MGIAGTAVVGRRVGIIGIAGIVAVGRGGGGIGRGHWRAVEYGTTIHCEGPLQWDSGVCFFFLLAGGFLDGRWLFPERDWELFRNQRTDRGLNSCE